MGLFHNAPNNMTFRPSEILLENTLCQKKIDIGNDNLKNEIKPIHDDIVPKYFLVINQSTFGDIEDGMDYDDENHISSFTKSTHNTITNDTITNTTITNDTTTEYMNLLETIEITNDSVKFSIIESTTEVMTNAFNLEYINDTHVMITIFKTNNTFNTTASNTSKTSTASNSLNTMDETSNWFIVRIMILIDHIKLELKNYFYLFSFSTLFFIVLLFSLTICVIVLLVKS